MLLVLMVFIALALIVGIISRRSAYNFVSIVILLAILTPFIGALLHSLPWWISILLMIAAVICSVKFVMQAVFGRAAMASFMGHVLYSAFLLPFRFIGHLMDRR